MLNYQHTLTTAGGRITCPRCTATSTRTKQQCGRPALKASKTQKCQFHSGRGSGAKTAEGRARIAAAHYVHGEATKAAREEHSRSSVYLAQLEEILQLLSMTTATRTRGRKPNGYRPIRTYDDVRQMVADRELNRVGGVTQAK